MYIGNLQTLQTSPNPSRGGGCREGYKDLRPPLAPPREGDAESTKSKNDYKQK